MALSGCPQVRCGYTKDRILHGLESQKCCRVLPDIFGGVCECIAHPGVSASQWWIDVAGLQVRMRGIWHARDRVPQQGIYAGFVQHLPSDPC